MDSALVDCLLILVGLVLTLGTALFVVAEFSLVSIDSATVEHQIAAGNKKARPVLYALRHLSTQLSGAQIGITITTILLGYTTQNAIARLSTQALGSTGLALGVATAIGAIVALILTNLLSMIFGELVPKNLALADPLRSATLVVRFQLLFTKVFRPFVWALNGSANWILRRFGIEPAEELTGVRSAQELAALVRRSAEEGTLDTSTAAIFTRSIQISDLAAKDIMTDRGRLHYLDESDTADAIIELARRTGHSRFPVVGEGLDDILGIVNLRRAVAVPFERRGEVPVTSSSLMSETPRVPETMELAPLLVLLRDEGLQMAVVLDEYGGTSGIVTLEDAVEEIVGEVADEHDPRRRGIQFLGADEWAVVGHLRPDELAAKTGLEVPDGGPYETLGGLVMTELGRIPVQGDEVRLEGVVLRVERMEGRRVERLRVSALPQEHSETEGSDV